MTMHWQYLDIAGDLLLLLVPEGVVDGHVPVP